MSDVTWHVMCQNNYENCFFSIVAEKPNVNNIDFTKFMSVHKKFTLI